MKNIGLLIILLSVIISCAKNNKSEGYTINGALRNLPDSTSVVMYLDMDTVLDSTIVMNEKFRFKGKIERPRRVMLRIESTKEGRLFWLENKMIDITGEKGNIQNSQIEGSTTQDEAELLLSRKDSIYEKMESLRDMITDANRDSLFLVHEKMIDQEVEINKEFIKDYPNSYESITVLNDGTMQRLGPLETGKLFSLMNDSLRSTKEGKTIADFIKLPASPKVGEQYVDFKQKNMEGQSVKFSEVIGKYTLLEFWASWCGPCRSSNPELIQLYERYKDNGFTIVGVSLDTNKEKWIKAVQQDGLNWQNLSDLKGFHSKPAEVYGVTAIPENFLIDENGIIIARYLRGNNLEKKLKELLEK
ncbi:TlpA disulfide reductase family protein [Salegentibacter echinorum]|nr:TlpA disulfide reductase family protein [Salegentibacter echinorum]